MRGEYSFPESPMFSILERSSEGIAIVTGESARIVYANPVFCSWLGNSLRIDSGIPIGEVLELIDAPPVGAAALVSLADLSSGSCPARLLTPGRPPRPIEIRVGRVMWEGELLYGVLMSPSEERRAGTEEWNSFRRDPLTDVWDRTFLTSRLRELIAGDRAADHRFAVLFVDLDNFKQVNDAFGHLVGDRVLQEVARRLTRCVRAHDHVVRFGGDEFVVLAEQLATPGDIDSIIRRIHGVLEKPIALPEGAIALSVSIGVAESSPAHRSPEDVLAAADRAMYAAKRSAAGPSGV